MKKKNPRKQKLTRSTSVRTGIRRPLTFYPARVDTHGLDFATLLSTALKDGFDPTKYMHSSARALHVMENVK